MFAMVQFPLADFRSLAPERHGQLNFLDHNPTDLANVFLRGFGNVVARNNAVDHLKGESVYADFNRAARFRGRIWLRERDWKQDIFIYPWFRRLYYDGFMAGRFEFGFVANDRDETAVFEADGAAPYSIEKIVSALMTMPIAVRSADLPTQELPLRDIAGPLGLAYLAATTRRSALEKFPIAETHRRFVAVGPPLVHLRFTNKTGTVLGRDCHKIEVGDGRDMIVTSAKAMASRNSVLMQFSETDTFDETPGERALRVVFLHFNAVIFAIARLLWLEQQDDVEFERNKLRALIDRTITRIAGFADAPNVGPKDTAELQAIAVFGKAFQGRSAELMEQLKTLAEALDKPTVLDNVLALLKVLVIESAKTGIKATTGGVLKKLGV